MTTVINAEKFLEICQNVEHEFVSMSTKDDATETDKLIAKSVINAIDEIICQCAKRTMTLK